MLENIVAWVLNTYIGEYLEDLNTDQLSVALLSGQLELENVPLKNTALRKLDLPIEVKSGLLGRLTLSVPITRIRSEPWTLTLSDVLVIVGPPSSAKKYDVEVMEQMEQQKKSQMLVELEQRHRTELLSLMGLPDTTTQDNWWGASLLSTVLNNIQLIMTNVHIRYEDNTTLPHGLAFNCGVRIQKMTVQTTNSSWKPGFVEPQEGHNVFKTLDLKGFSLYWNSDQTVSSEVVAPKDLRDILAPENRSNSYIIHPCSAELRMERNSSKFPLKSTPRFKFFLKPDKIVCELTKRQMAELRALNREWARFELARRHRKWRPLTAIGTNAREWWKFAYERITEERRRSQTRKTWSFAITRAQHLNAYCNAYRRRLLECIERKTTSESNGTAPAATVTNIASQEDQTIMKQIERDPDLSFHELHLFRETVFRRLVAQKEKELGLPEKSADETAFETLETAEVPADLDSIPPKDEGKGLYGWITSFFVADEPKTQEEDKNSEFAQIDLSELKSLPQSFNMKDMEEEILDVLHESWDDSTILRRDAIFADIAIRLDNITLRFIDSSVVAGIEQRRVLALDLSGVSAQVELSPRQHTLSVQLAVQDMSVQRLCTGHTQTNGGATPSEMFDDSLFYSVAESTKILLAVGKKDGAEKEPIFRLRYRRSAPKLTVRHTVEGRFRPISVMYEEDAFAGLSTLFADDPMLYKAAAFSNSETPSEHLIDSHVFVNLHIPSIVMELCQQGWSTSHSRQWEAGEPFAGVQLNDVFFCVINKERYLSQVKIDVGHVEMTDPLEKAAIHSTLLTTGRTIGSFSKTISNSCPDISAVPVEHPSPAKQSSSAPNQCFLANVTHVHKTSRKVSHFGGDSAETRILVTIVDSKHPLFDSKYKSNCKVDVAMNELSVGMNRRTWTALMDLAGLLGHKTPVEEDEEERDELAESVAAPFTVECSLRTQVLTVDMNYPRNGTKLGVIRLIKPEILFTVSSRNETGVLSALLALEGLNIEDHTPLYSELYRERMYISDEGGIVPSRAELCFTKYLGNDPARDCDLRIGLMVPNTMHVSYIHTHRFFIGLMDFWMHFFELQQQITRRNGAIASNQQSRVSLDIDIRSPTTLIFPLNQFSDQVVVLESSGVRVNNCFKNMSRVMDEFHVHCVETEYGYDDTVDCLLDCSKITLFDLAAYEGLRVDKSHHREEKLCFQIESERTFGPGIFEHFEFHVSRNNQFNKKFNLVTDVYRNLDGTLSHNAPDMTAVMAISGLSWQITTDFYILFRGVLEKNFADPLITVPETIPLEILNIPASGCEVTTDRKYATLCFRLLFDNVLLDFRVPESLSRVYVNPFSKLFVPFGEAHLHSARISFDLFSDSQSELDLVCESADLVDSRKGHLNLFKNILQPRERSGHRGMLMFETHVMMKKDEPPQLTVVLMNSRVLVLPEWLNDAKDFLNLCTDFVPKYWEDTAQVPTLARDGVVGRLAAMRMSPIPAPSVSLKITFRECDLYLMENPCASNSLATVASVSVVLNMTDTHGDINANLEIQSMTIGWCLMQDEANTLNMCSNEFSIGISLMPGVPISATSQAIGLPQLAQRKHSCEIELRGIIGRLAYKDAVVLNTAVRGFLKHFDSHFGKSLIPAPKHSLPQKSLHVERVKLTSPHMDLWLLDEYKGVSIPMLRFSLSNLNIDKRPDRVTATVSSSADYFNHSVFGWEPLIEKWDILRFLCQKKDKLKIIELVAQSKSTLDITLTEQFMQQAVQWMNRWPAIRASLERDDFRSFCGKSRAYHLPYLIRNETGCDVVFTTAVEDIQLAKKENRASSVRWMNLPSGKEQTFAFPSKLLLYSQSEREPPRQLIVRVVGWEEISPPVSVDACGTYFRVIKTSKVGGFPNVRLVIRVMMEKDGRKLVSVRSSMDISNSLPHPIHVFAEGSQKEIMSVEPSATLPVPLSWAHQHFRVVPVGTSQITEKAELSWRAVRVSGECQNRTQRLATTNKGMNYWLCTSVRREFYPEEGLPGHSIFVVSPLSVQNLLPVDVEVRMQDQVFAISAGKECKITTIDITRDIQMWISTDRLTSVTPCTVAKGSIGEGVQVNMRLRDNEGRHLDVYGNLKISTGSSIILSLWVPYWIVNKSGIPLVLKQEAAQSESAGQMDEHEQAKDKNPLMFSFADDGCPHSCVVRVGRHFVREPGFVPMYSSKFSLIPGVQAIKLKLEHATLPTLYYNIGVEVRPGTGRYKDTQVVLLTSRFLLNNQSSAAVYVCHYDLIDRPSEHIAVAAQSTLVWNEKVEDQRMLCCRRADVRHWSCPFRIDRVGSFHVTMRDADETPHFVRVEIALSSAVFCVTFTDASYYPPPIRIENLSDVPVLYQQQSDNVIRQHLRTICKARSHVDYAWDDLYGRKRIVLQVYENKSNSYDPSQPGPGPMLVYENHMFIKLTSSFNTISMTKKPTDECELVVETLQKGKVILNKQNKIDANGCNQLWKLCDDGCIENIGMTARSRTRMVLDVLEKMGNQLMMAERNPSRDRFQKWTFMPDGRLCPQHYPNLLITAKGTEVCLGHHDSSAVATEDGVADTQQWQISRQRPGSGALCVECLYSGPTLVVQIRDKEARRVANNKSLTSVMAKDTAETVDVSVTMRGGFGLSLVNGQYEELIYAHFGGIVGHARNVHGSYQATVSVDVIQVDNQLLDGENWQVLFCQAEEPGDGEGQVELPAGIPATARPALKLEMNCTPQNNYIAFDCFRLKLCDFSVLLNELLLWKIVQFAQASDAASRVQEKALSLPPNTDLERPDPLKTRRCFFGTLDLEMGQISLSVVTVPKSGLPPGCRKLKQQFNVKLISFENAVVTLPPFRQFHYFETSSFLMEAMQKFYLAELQKQTMKFVVTLDAFGNPQGFIAELKDSFQGLFIEGDVQRFVAGIGYGVSNSISKVASSISSGVGSITFDQNHEARRRNMIRSQSASSTPLSHLYSGVKGLSFGLLGGVSAILTNTINESKQRGYVQGAFIGLYTGAVDTVTKPVQGIFDLVEGTASAFKEMSGSGAANSRRSTTITRVRSPRLCRDLYHLLPSYSRQHANAQMEMLRINGYSLSERLLDIEVTLEQFTEDGLVRQYALISTKQVYICKQVNNDPSNVIQRIVYMAVKHVQARPELANSVASIEVQLETYDRKGTQHVSIWCSRYDVARRLAEKLLRAKHEFDHNMRTLSVVKE